MDSVSDPYEETDTDNTSFRRIPLLDPASLVGSMDARSSRIECKVLLVLVPFVSGFLVKY